MKFSHYSATNVGRVRKANEDSFGDIACQNGAHAYAVCDGMGGHVGGATASQMAVKCILEFLAKADMTDCEFAIRQACNYANTQVFATASNDSSLQGMGTTCVVLVIKGDYCYFGHVGDSRLYLYTSKELHRLTRDQSYVQMLVDSGELSDDMAETHPKKNQILQAIGISEEITPKTCELRISPKKGDKLLLCTDGLNGMMNDKVIASAFRNNDSLKSCAENLIQLALDNGGRDNVTVSLVEITESTHVSSLFKSENPVPSAPGTEMFPVPKKAMNWKSFYKKYKIHVIASSAAICVLVVSLLLMRPTEESKTIEDTPNTNKETTTGQGSDASSDQEVITIKELIGKKADDLEKLKKTKISDFYKDTTLVSNDGKIKIRIKQGVFTEFEEIIDTSKSEGEKNNSTTGNNAGTKTEVYKEGQILEVYKVKNDDKFDLIVDQMKEKYKGCNLDGDIIANENGINQKGKIYEKQEIKIICHK